MDFIALLVPDFLGKMNFIAMLFPGFQCAGTVGCFEHVVTEARQDISNRSTQPGFILDEQNCFIAAARWFRRWRHKFLVGSFGEARKINSERRSMTDFAVNIDPAFVLLDDSEDGCQSKTGSFADILGGEERLKNLRKNFRRDAAARIAYAQADEFAGTDLSRM